MTTRPRGLSLRMRLTLSYAGFLLVAGGALLAGLVLLVLHYLPAGNLQTIDGDYSPGRRDLVEATLPWFARGMLFLLVVGVAGGWVLAGRMLRPLEPIDRAVRAAAGGSLSHRIDLPGTDDELRRLADGFDEMLARLEDSFEEQRRFTANASHELRTPLAVTKAMLEVARADPEGVDEATLARLDETNERSIAIIEALLALARIDRGTLASQPVDLEPVVRSAVAEVPDGIALTCRTAPSTVAGDPVLLHQLVANLVRNAVIHNRTTAGFVDVVLEPAAGRARLTVENSGPDIPPGVVGTLTEPFVRLASRTSDAGRGSGLGLAIVTSICRVHHADLVLTARAGGGLVVTVDVPTA
ncbi:HAMP domain-containing sensor histidine kinase [Aeromicrobium sp. Leaf350]|uniref:sensor histidine kinase n=1 Tax=Aeromicrobium sp. Leaf350 TaxID=2876565 RepID=UPI001E45C50C|nr:HAMP domain-containing sensor histidine kinase [Aeromicrobium sp. Leaf350]